MRILLGKTPWSTSSLSIGPRSRRASKKRNELPPELRATIVRDVNRNYRREETGHVAGRGHLRRIFPRALALLAVYVELGGGLS